MKKSIPFYTFILLLSMCVFSVLLPYPIFSRYTNSTESQISKASNYHETEVEQTDPAGNLVLDINWSDGINNLLEIGSSYELYDFSTSQYFSVTRIGGNAHADIVPTSEEDYLFIKENLSDSKCVPVVLVYNSTTIIPASLSPYMHGYSDQDGTYFGHYCLHFKNSQMHSTKTIDTCHQKAIKAAKKQANTVFDD